MPPFDCRGSCATRRRSLPPFASDRRFRPPLCPLPPQSEYDAGAGTCVRATFICATLVGEKRVLPVAEGESEQVRMSCGGCVACC